MTLTPLHVRGKRKSKPPAAASSRASSLSSHRDSALEDDGAPPPAQKPKRSLSATIAHRKASRRHSPIENLPLEILEPILLYCRSFALPRASHLIGAKLSGKATLFKLFFAAFHDTWKQGFGKTSRGPASFLLEGSDKMLSELESFAGDPELQSEMLKLPWVKIDFVLETQQVWADKYARDRPYEHWLGSEFECGPPISHDLKHSPPSSSEGSSFNARACFEADYSQLLSWDLEMAGEVGECYLMRTHDVHPLAHIPPKLLAGPWTEPQRRLFFWLMRSIAGGHARKVLPPWETRVECIRNALINVPSPDMVIEKCLMVGEKVMECSPEPWLFRDLPTDVAGDLVDDISKRLKWGDDSEDTQHMLVRTRGRILDAVDGRYWRKNISRWEDE